MQRMDGMDLARMLLARPSRWSRIEAACGEWRVRTSGKYTTDRSGMTTITVWILLALLAMAGCSGIDRPDLKADVVFAGEHVVFYSKTWRFENRGCATAENVRAIITTSDGGAEVEWTTSPSTLHPGESGWIDMDWLFDEITLKGIAWD